ncbi:MAG: rhomboid family intramembrane serine protease [Candidatus Nanopelagicales bacterium]|nr:rhomboid family intramembrane serine protease [Candidatus Nanopelagicales bacterium]
MIQAPVGYRCPDCMRTEQPVQPTTVAGATAIAKPYVTYTLIVINLLVFAYQYSVGINAVAERWGMWPVGIVTGDEWYRLLTSAFLHGSFLHIAFNMYVLFALGPTLERILGHVRFTALYLLSALGGGVVSYFFSDITTVSVGASGAIFGLMGALVVAGRRLRYDVTQVLVLLGINVVIGFLAPGIDWRAHLGGLVTGALVAAILVHAPRKSRTFIQVAGLGGVLLILVAVAMLRTSQIQELLAPLGVITT